MERIYLDHAATSPLDERVLEKMIPHFSGNFGNPSSIHSFGRESRKWVD
ncbi:aminotransferase class V-fold PLP-dependent enzyme, partial [Bacillus inaquosorum]